MDLINVVSLNDNTFNGVSIGTATAKRNALMAGAARIVFRHAFPADCSSSPVIAAPMRANVNINTNANGGIPSPPLSDSSIDQAVTLPNGHGHSADTAEVTANDNSQKEALKIARSAIRSLIDLTLDLLGDGSVVRPETTALSLGGGLWQSPGYRGLLLDGLKNEGVVFREFMVIADAAGEGARGVAQVEFGH